jgi:sortase (surface protein transpeptidase)
MADGRDTTLSTHGRSTWRGKAAVGIALALLGVALLWASVGGASTPESVSGGVPAVDPTTFTSPPSPGVTKSPTPRPLRNDVRDQISSLVLPESHPLALSIPRIGVSSRLVDLGLDPNGELEVPRDPATAGWFSGGAAPGALGPAVIAGHVTWNGAPAVFYRLAALRHGDRVQVNRRDGRTAVFTVTRVAQFTKSRFPTQAVYGEVNNAALRLITCGGTYDQARHRYLDNVVVFARLSAVRDQHR